MAVSFAMSAPVEVVYTPEIFYQQRLGGISRYFVELAEHLRAAGQQPRIAAGLHRNEYLRFAGSITTGIYLPFGIGPLHKARIWFNHALCQLVARRHPRAVVHQTYYGDSAYLGHRRLVVTVYDLIHERFRDTFPELNNPNDPVVKYQRAACLRADHLIAISHATKDDLIRFFGIDPAKITVIHLASALSVSAPGLAPPLRAGKDGGDEPYLLYVGARSGYKNFAALLEAYGRSSSLRRRFRLVCFGGGPFDTAERKSLAAAGLSDRVTQRSGGDAALIQCYRGAAAFVCPSLYEGFGLPVLEAMSQDCPVLCAWAGSLPEVAGEAAAYFDPASVDSIQTVLEATLADQFVLNSLRTLGRARVPDFRGNVARWKPARFTGAWLTDDWGGDRRSNGFEQRV